MTTPSFIGCLSRSQSHRGETKKGESMNQKPVHEIKVGGIRATIWRNETNGKTIHNVTVSRIYKAGEKFEQTTSFSRSHLPRLYEAILKADHWIALREPTVA